MHQLSLGKVRALQSASTERAILNREQLETVQAEQLTDIKLSIIKMIWPRATSMLLDPVNTTYHCGDVRPSLV